MKSDLVNKLKFAQNLADNVRLFKRATHLTQVATIAQGYRQTEELQDIIQMAAEILDKEAGSEYDLPQA